MLQVSASRLLRFGSIGLAVVVWIAAVMLDPADARSRRNRLKPAPAASAEAPVAVAPAVVVTAATLPSSPFADDDAEQPVLTVGPVTATVHQEEPLAPIEPGKALFANVTIAGSGPVELLVEAEGGIVQALLGSAMTAGPREIGNAARGQLARFDLGQGGQNAITIEMTAGTADRARLRLTLSSLAGTLQTAGTVFGWRRPSCAETYHMALRDIARAKVPLMGPATDAALAVEPALRGAWLFGPPSMPVVVNAAAPVADPAKAVRKCIDQRTRQDYVTGEQIKLCRRWAGEAVPQPAVAAADRIGVAEIVALADGFVKSKLALRSFERKRVLRLKSFDLFNSLRHYIEQPAHPALCTGAEAMLDYYVTYTSPLSDSIARVERVADAAADLAVARIDALLGPPAEAVADAGNAGATWIATANAASAVDRGTALRERFAALARYLTSPADAERLLAEPSLVRAFAALASIIEPAPPASGDAPKAKHTKAKNNSKPQVEPVVAEATVMAVAYVPAVAAPVDPALIVRRAAAKDALAMLEAAIVLEGAREKFVRFRTAGYDTVDAIRAAHRQHCTCAR